RSPTGVRLTGLVGRRNDFEDVAADEDPVALLEPALDDPLPVHERAVRGAEILDVDLSLLELDPRVLPRHHLLDENHVEVARPPDDDRAVLLYRKLAPLVLSGDEPESEPG